MSHRHLLFFAFLFVCQYNLLAQAVTHRFKVHPSSVIRISGSTSVNSYQCSNTQYTGRDTLALVQQQKGQAPVFTRGAVSMKVSGFNCGMQVMTNDFLTTIKATQHPIITIKFISFARLPKYTPEEERFKCKLIIFLAGVSKEFEITCGITKDKSGFIHLKGARDFKFGDFGLVPPEKMMGMIKVKDELHVDFHLVLSRVINNALPAK